MTEGPTFDDRAFMAHQAVYEQILRGEVDDVEAALMDATFNASQDD